VTEDHCDLLSFTAIAKLRSCLAIMIYSDAEKSDRVSNEMESSANKENCEKLFRKDQSNLSAPAVTPAFTALCLICR
jgi:hypothetical protein